jgi:hypothetical protein
MKFNQRTNLLNMFFRIWSRFCENEILGLYRGPKATILYTQEICFLELVQYGYHKICLRAQIPKK